MFHSILHFLHLINMDNIQLIISFLFELKRKKEKKKKIIKESNQFHNDFQYIQVDNHNYNFRLTLLNKSHLIHICLVDNLNLSFIFDF